jgi:serine/threonine protein kinase
VEPDSPRSGPPPSRKSEASLEIQPASRRSDAALDASPVSLPPLSAQPASLQPVQGHPRPSPSSGPDEWDEREAVRAAANRELNADLLGPVVGRVAAIAGVTGAVLAAYLGGLFLFVPRSEAPWPSLFPTLVTLLAVAIVLSAAIYAVTKLKQLRPQIVHDLGYLYLILLSLLLGLMRHSYPWPESEVVRQISPVVIPILAFGALIPASPRASLAVLLAAACMDPLAFYFMRAHQAPPALHDVLLLAASPLLAALIGQRISRAVHHLSEGIVKAREVGSYQLVERLGVGGMAEVWRADHRMLARPAAVKLIRPHILGEHGQIESERLLRLFLREGRATASLSSPHTIQVYDFGITREGAFYYVMELLHGVDLKTLVDRFGPQTPERAAYLLSQVCLSLAEAHERDFVHRDVKPANIFTCRLGGEADFVKVLDFGLVLDRHPTAAELEDEQRFVGTPAIMAPEMVRFQAPVDARADLYAVGCVGYWLLTGKRVFEAETRHDMLVMHAHQKPQTPSARIGKPIHPGLEALIMACLEKNPKKRPQTARELRERLDALVFSPPWTAERADLWWKRYRPAEAKAEAEAERASLPPSGTSVSEAKGAPDQPVERVTLG